MYSKTTIVGNLGRDPEMRYMSDGTAVTTFSVATTDFKKNTYWYRVSVWGKSAEACNQYLAKGSRVLVEGSLQGDPQTGGPRIWNRKDGSLATGFEIRANEVKFLSGREESVAVSGGAVEEDGIPF